MQYISYLKRALVVAGTTVVASLSASVLNFQGLPIDVELTAGSGSQSAMVIVSYPYAPNPSFAFLYQWDGAHVLTDAFNQIELDSAGAFDWDGAAFVGQMDYTDPETSVLYQASTTGWISMWNNPNADPSTGWETNMVGHGSVALTDGSWHWVNTDVEGDWPGAVPDVFATVVVPEPGQAALLVGLGALLYLVRRRRMD